MRDIVFNTSMVIGVLGTLILAYEAWRKEGNGWGLAVLFVPIVWLYCLLSRPSPNGAYSLLCVVASIALALMALWL